MITVVGRQMCNSGTVIMIITTLKPSLGHNRRKTNDYQCIYSHVRYSHVPHPDVNPHVLSRRKVKNPVTLSMKPVFIKHYKGILKAL